MAGSAVSGSQPRAVLHVGAPKSGTTFLQSVLWRNRASLATAGVRLLGRDQGQVYRAGKDLREIPFDPNDPGADWRGAWQRIADQAAASTAQTVVLSDEHLAAATAEQAARALLSLAPRAVEVVYGIRPMAGLLPSEWQEYVKHGSTQHYDDWVRQVLGSASDGPGRWFWSVHDAGEVLRRWSGEGVRQHVLVMPPKDAPAGELWRRFATVLDVDVEAVESAASPANPALGVLEAEVLRRVNDALPADFPRWHQTGLARDVLANQVLGPMSDRVTPVLPPDLRAEVAKRAGAVVSGLERSGATVHGDLADLVTSAAPAHDALTPSPVPLPSEADVAGAAVASLAGLLVEMGHMRDRRRESERVLRQRIEVLQGQARQVTVRKGLKSGVRRWGERNRVVGSLVARYDARHAQDPA